ACFKCGEVGHIAFHCQKHNQPESPRKSVSPSRTSQKLSPKPDQKLIKERAVKEKKKNLKKAEKVC
ncbi:MAG: hypothetical protein Q8755_02740, partial [Candidatus Phytoplasma australasiaticum]|nr:hypothetical protein [Candidatus Phytoplasma australasiaticum]